MTRLIVSSVFGSHSSRSIHEDGVLGQLAARNIQPIPHSRLHAIIQPAKIDLEVRTTSVSADDLLASFSDCRFSKSCLQSTGASKACERRRTTTKKNKVFIMLEEVILLAPLHESGFLRESADGYESDAEGDLDCVLYRGPKDK
jgi:hypothetical protein